MITYEIYVTICEIHVITYVIHVNSCVIHLTTCKIHVITCNLGTRHCFNHFIPGNFPGETPQTRHGSSCVTQSRDAQYTIFVRFLPCAGNWIFVTSEANTALQTVLSCPLDTFSVRHTVISSSSRLFSKLYAFLSFVIVVDKLE